MDSNQVVQLKNVFDQIVHITEDGIEFWYARELQSALGYTRWENFVNTDHCSWLAQCDSQWVERYLLTVLVSSKATRNNCDFAAATSCINNFKRSVKIGRAGGALTAYHVKKTVQP